MTADEFLALLVEACPSFAPRWEQELAEAAADDEEPIYIAVIDDFGGHLGRLSWRGETLCFPAVFEVLNRGLVEGDDQVKLARADELVDDLATSNRTYRDPDDFEPFLGPVARELWERKQRGRGVPDPGAEQVLDALMRHNPAQLKGDLRREYRRVARYLPSLLARTESLDMMRRFLWANAWMKILPEIVGPEERFDAVAQEAWAQRSSDEANGSDTLSTEDHGT